MSGGSAVCGDNITTANTMRNTLVMCTQTVTDALYVTVAKSISTGSLYLALAEVQPLRRGKRAYHRGWQMPTHGT